MPEAASHAPAAQQVVPTAANFKSKALLAISRTSKRHLPAAAEYHLGSLVEVLGRLEVVADAVGLSAAVEEQMRGRSVRMMVGSREMGRGCAVVGQVARSIDVAGSTVTGHRLASSMAL